MSRTRTVSAKSPSVFMGTHYGWSSPGNPAIDTTEAVLFKHTSVITDEVHPLWKLGIRSGDIGGPLTLYRRTHSCIPSDTVEIYRNGSPSPPGLAYRGRLSCTPFYNGNAEWSDLGFSNLNNEAASFGPQLWNMARPAKPNFNALNAIYELREVPDMLRQRFTPNLRGAGNYWLALQFGWKPLLSDIRSFVETHFDMKRIMEQLLRDEGKPVRRSAKMTLDAEIDRAHMFSGYNLFPETGGFVSQIYRGPETGLATVTNTKSVRLAGRFRYWLPPGPRDWRWTARMLSRIYGLNPTPSVVYNAIPWSWLVDWFSNVGDVIENVSGGVEDRFAADYAYVTLVKDRMRKTSVTGAFDGKTVNDVVTASASVQNFSRLQFRVPASPFGFSIKDNQLSAMQWSILGALGLSRLRK